MDWSKLESGDVIKYHCIYELEGLVRKCRIVKRKGDNFLLEELVTLPKSSSSSPKTAGSQHWRKLNTFAPGWELDEASKVDLILKAYQ